MLEKEFNQDIPNNENLSNSNLSNNVATNNNENIRKNLSIF